MNMIEIIKNSESDNEKLSRLFIPKNMQLENFDFSKVIVKKPWGYEYLLYDDGKISMWVLHLRKDNMTSMHCHVYKKTALIVLQGEVVCATLNKGFLLKEKDGLLLDKKVFHSTQAVSGDAILLEVETPSLKSDVVRLVDAYGRESIGYESPHEMSYDISHYDVRTLHKDETREKRIGKVSLSLVHFPEEATLDGNTLWDQDLLVLIEGELWDSVHRQAFVAGDLVAVERNSVYSTKRPVKALQLRSCKNIKALLFDFDGVLADTMEDNYQAWKQAFHDYDIDLQREEYFPFEGVQLSLIAQHVSEKHGLHHVHPEEIIAKKEQYYQHHHSFSFYPGVLELLDALKQKNVKMAIVSAARKERILATVPLHVLQQFDAVITGDVIEKGKPHPDPYLKAMKALNVVPDECIIIENAPVGIESAKRAGACCIAISSTIDASYLSAADTTIASFSELKNVDAIMRLLAS